MSVRQLLSLACAIMLAGTALRPGDTAAQENGDDEDDSPALEERYHMVGGYRHGKSYFKKTHYPEIQPLQEGVLDFQHYHTYGEITDFLHRWAEAYPDILDLYVGGASFEGRDVYQVTLTNKKTGKDTDKPAIAIDNGACGLSGHR